MKTVVRYSNLHDGGRLPEEPEFTCVMVKPPDTQTLRTRTWLLSLSPEKLLKKSTKPRK